MEIAENATGPTRNVNVSGTIIIDDSTLQAAAHAASNACDTEYQITYVASVGQIFVVDFTIGVGFFRKIDENWTLPWYHQRHHHLWLQNQSH